MREEGWYTDPYGLHDRRWFSDGSPTKVVSDNGTTSDDPPPNTPYVSPPEPVAIRQDWSMRAPRHKDSGVKEAWEAFLSTGGD